MGLRIARVVPGFLPIKDAYGYYVTFAMLSKAQQDLGNEVTIFSPTSGPNAFDGGFDVTRVANPPPAYFAFGSLLSRRLRNFDVIHGHARAALPLAALSVGPPVVIHLHGLPYGITEQSKAFDAHDATAFGYYRAFLRRADAVITYCESLRRKVIDLFRLDPGRVTHVPNGVQGEFFEGKDDARGELGLNEQPVVLYVGRFSEIKGIFEFLKSIPMILRRLPEVKVLFVGCNAKLPSYLARHRISGSCISVPHVPYDAMGRYYRSADVHVALSKVYGYQKTVLESIAAGTPVVSSDYPDSRTIAGRAGIYADPGDPSGIADAVCSALCDRRIKLEARIRSREILRNYTWSATARRLEMVYEAL